MRKLFWGLTALCVAVVGGVIWLQYEGSGFDFAATAAITSSSVLGSSDAPSVVGGEEDLTKFQKPEEPVEMVDLKDPVAATGQTGVIELTPTPVSAPAPVAVALTPVVPAITIHEPIEVSKSVAVAESGSWAGEFTTTGPKVDPALMQANIAVIGRTHGEIQSVPRVMPYAEDDEEPVQRMEYAVEEELIPAPQIDMDDDDMSDEPGCLGDGLSIWSFFVPTVQIHACNHGTTGQQPADCREDEHYHDQYSGCPYTGCLDPDICTPLPYVEPTKHTAPTAAPGSQEESETSGMNQMIDIKSLRQFLKKLADESQLWPASKGLDTMEFRKSDRKSYEHLPNPL